MLRGFGDELVGVVSKGNPQIRVPSIEEIDEHLTDVYSESRSWFNGPSQMLERENKKAFIPSYWTNDDNEDIRPVDDESGLSWDDDRVDSGDIEGGEDVDCKDNEEGD
ncbi:hypothetical protein WN944_023197 [Citrus x changshan-huyou]|uniref:Uncharacterized protein n=1 Tax=Citrus x changshan-huyou TaxID=2935761 RepID=A0AAP0MZP8_9ROSI